MPLVRRINGRISMSRHVMLRLAATTLLATGFATAGLAQDAPGVTKTEIRFGAWSALTGPFAVYGVPGVAGQNAYYSIVNAAGGIKGRKITVVTEDHAFNPQQAVTAARKLVDSDKVFAIQGSYGTGPGAATFPYLQQQGVPYIMPYGGAQDWYEPLRPLVIGAQVLFEDQARVIGRWAAKDGFKNILVVHGAVAAMQKVAVSVEPGVKSANPAARVEVMPVKLGTTDYAPIALDIAGKKPDAIIYIGSIVEMAAMAKELRQQNVKIQLYSYGGSVNNDVIALGGEAVEGMRGVSYTLPIDTDTPAIREYREALAKYEPKEKPDYGSLLTFALAKITAEALRQADEPLTRESLVKGFEKLKDYDSGIIGKITITPDNHLGTNLVQRVELRGGKWVTVGNFVDAKSDW